LCCSNNKQRRQEDSENGVKDFRQSCYYPLAKATQKYGVFVIVIIVATSMPFIYHVPELKFSEGVQDLMPRGTECTVALQTIQSNFGASVVFPTTLLLKPSSDIDDVTNTTWLTDSCEAIVNITDSMDLDLKIFSGVNIFQGKCLPAPAVTDLIKLDTNVPNAEKNIVPLVCGVIGGGECKPLCEQKIPKNYTKACTILCPLLEKFLTENVTDCDHKADEYLELVHGLLGTYVSKDLQALQLKITLSGNPFDEDGQRFIKNWREKAAAYLDRNPSVGQMYLIGQGPIQMDTADAVFAKFPLMIGVTIAIVFVLIGIAFQSLVVPFRAVLCLTLMLGVSFGLAIMAYQNGFLDWMHFKAVSQNDSHALYWMSPMLAFSVMVGLGLDYDVFLMESVKEARKNGLNDSEAVMSGLCQTGNIISVAGVVMLIAFSSILFSSTPALNQIAFLLLVALTIDCFITTKFIIPSAMAMLGKKNFWPLKMPVFRSVVHEGTSKGETSSVPVAWRIFCCGSDRQRQ